MDLASLLSFAKQSGASDLHLSAGAPPMVRIDGDMRKLEVEGEDLSARDRVRALIYGLLTDSQKKRLEAEWELDCAISLGTEDRFRANIFVQERGLSAVMRVIPNAIRTAEDLGLPPVFRDVADLENGLVLVTGPTGSGKSTTLAAVIDHINRTRRGHIITIEDPIEFIHRPRLCMVNQREVGAHSKAFRNALRAALREDPDVILVGELRDHETIALAMTAAETGHLVFGTLHTSSAAKTVDRVINVFPAEEQLQIREMFAGSFRAIIAQILVKRKGGGRTAVHEVLLATDAARAMIRDGKSFQLPSVIQTGGKAGMQTLEHSLERQVRQGTIELRVAIDTLVRLHGIGTEDAASRLKTAQDEDAPAGGHAAHGGLSAHSGIGRTSGPHPAPAGGPPTRRADELAQQKASRKIPSAAPGDKKVAIVLEPGGGASRPDPPPPVAAPPSPPPPPAPPPPPPTEGGTTQKVRTLDLDELVFKVREQRKRGGGPSERPAT